MTPTPTADPKLAEPKKKGGLFSSLGIEPRPVPKTKKARERLEEIDEVMPSLF